MGVHRHLGIFEPVDFVRFTRGLVRTEYRDDRVVHAISKWASKRVAEFSTFDWEEFLTGLEALGARSDRLDQLRTIAPPQPQMRISDGGGADAIGFATPTDRGEAAAAVRA